MKNLRLPNFIIIGAKKAGTSSLYSYCDQHPDIYMSRLKEPKFFSFDENNQEHRNRESKNFPIRSVEQYLKLFSGVTSEKVIGEASAGYLPSLIAPSKIKAFIPDAKLVVSLRSPVDRAYSNFLMLVRAGREEFDITRMTEKEAHWIKASLYYENLKRYMEYFDRNNIKVILFDELKKDSLSVMKDLYQYLEVDSTFIPDISMHYNVGGLPKYQIINRLYAKLYAKHPKLQLAVKTIIPAKLRLSVSQIRRESNIVKAPLLKEEVRTELLEIFKPDILKLQDMLETDLTLWLGDDRSS